MKTIRYFWPTPYKQKRVRRWPELGGYRAKALGRTWGVVGPPRSPPWHSGWWGCLSYSCGWWRDDTWRPPGRDTDCRTAAKLHHTPGLLPVEYSVYVIHKITNSYSATHQFTDKFQITILFLIMYLYRDSIWFSNYSRTTDNQPQFFRSLLYQVTSWN